MSRRIEIELTSARPDGTWTWRAAGAQKPKGVLDGALLPAGAAVGQVLKADAEMELDGTTIVAVSAGKEKSAKSGLLELLPSDKPFEAVTQTLARRERSDRGDRGDRRDRGDRGDRRDRGDRGPRRDTGDRPRRDAGERGPRREGAEGDRQPRADRGPRPERRPRFQAPPELPQRPKAKRLKPGRAHRTEVLSALPEAERMVAERALQGGIPSVRQAVKEQNQRLRGEGREEIPERPLVEMAEKLLPRLRVAEWLDRADAAIADLDDLDLRDLRSVVAASEDPVVGRDESTRELAARLREALAAKQEKELGLWFDDIDAAIGVGRVVRALKLSSQPPKAGVRFPTELAGRLAAAATANLTADALPDRWVAVLEAAAFSPVRGQVQPAAAPTQVNDELRSTVKRLGSLLPQIAALFGIEVDAKAAPAKPLRPTRPATAKKPATPKAPAPKAPAAPAAAPVTEETSAPAAVEVEAAAPVEVEVDTSSVEAPVEAVADIEAPVTESAEAEAPAAE